MLIQMVSDLSVYIFILNRPPGPYTSFLTEFGRLLTDLVTNLQYSSVSQPSPRGPADSPSLCFLPALSRNKNVDCLLVVDWIRKR